MLQKLMLWWQKVLIWNGTLKPIHRAYLGLMLSLGLFQGILSIIVLLLGPDRPIGSR
jgi:hypothetical protein